MLLTNTVYVGLVKGATLGLRVVTLLIAAKFIDTTEFSIILIFTTTTEILKTVADFGIDTYNIKSLASCRSIRKDLSIIHNAISIKIALGLVVSLLGFFILKAYEPNASYLLIIAYSLMIPSSLVLNLGVNFYIAKNKAREIVFLILLINTLNIIAFTILISSTFAKDSAFLIIPIVDIITFIFLSINNPTLCIAISAWLKKITVLKIPIKTQILKESYPIAITTLIVITYSKLDIFFLHLYSTSNDLFNYGIINRALDILVFFSSSIGVSAYSHLSSLHDIHFSYKKTLAKYHFLILKYISLVLSLYILFYLLTEIKIFNLDFQEKNLLALLLIGFCLRSLNILNTAAIQSLGNFKTITKLAVFNLISFFLLYYLFIKVFRLGSLGVAISIIIIELINFILQKIFLMKILKQRGIL